MRGLTEHSPRRCAACGGAGCGCSDLAYAGLLPGACFEGSNHGGSSCGATRGDGQVLADG